MIPKHITRDAVLNALKKIDEIGVPRNRLSTKYNVVHQGKSYPPKYVISLANELTTGVELKPNEFGGGDESNGFLSNLGFEIRGEDHIDKINNTELLKMLKNEQETPQHPSLTSHPPNKKQITISTAVIHCKSLDAPSKKYRTQQLQEIVNESVDSDILLLPAGYFSCKTLNNSAMSSLEDDIAGLLQKAASSTIVCVGVDYHNGDDQLAYAIGKQGIIAVGRKFFPTDDERGLINPAKDYLAEEEEFKRIFHTNGFACYLAVCYDCFGIRRKNTQNPGVDVLLTLAHCFYPRGDGLSGDVDFARKGFAGASMQLHCPVFGTAVFFERSVPANWPTGVKWSGADSVKSFKYADNEMSWIDKREILGKHENVVINKYIIAK